MPTYKKKVSDGLGFAKKMPYEYENQKFDADIKDGDKITLLNAGIEEEGNFGMQTNFKIKTRNGEKKTSMNQRTINALIDEYGSEGESWIGKDLNVLMHKTIIGGKKCIVSYFVPNGWSMDEYGEIIKDGQTSALDDIDPEEIPF